MWNGVSHVFLMAVWLKMTPNPMKSHESFSRSCHENSMTWTSVKSMSCFQHGKQITPGSMTWNSHGIWCQFGPNCRQFVTWNYMEFRRESMSHFLQRQRNMAKDTLITRFARDQCSFRVICIIYRKPQMLSFHAITFSVFTIF